MAALILAFAILAVLDALVGAKPNLNSLNLQWSGFRVFGNGSENQKAYCLDAAGELGALHPIPYVQYSPLSRIRLTKAQISMRRRL